MILEYIKLIIIQNNLMLKNLKSHKILWIIMEIALVTQNHKKIFVSQIWNLCHQE